jgi:hypothetical protein
MHDAHSNPAQPFIYFFSVRMNGTHTGQTDALEFSDRAAAWKDASLSSVDLLREVRHEIAPGCKWQMEVVDHAGKAVFRFSFSADEL